MVHDLIAADGPPPFTEAPLVSFEDAEHIFAVFEAAAFDDTGGGVVLTAAATAIDLLVDLPCDGFLE